MSLNQRANIALIDNREILNFSACCDALYSQSKKNVRDFKTILNLLYLSLLLKGCDPAECNKAIQESEIEAVRQHYTRLDGSFLSTLRMIQGEMGSDCFIRKYCSYIERAITGGPR